MIVKKFLLVLACIILIAILVLIIGVKNNMDNYVDYESLAEESYKKDFDVSTLEEVLYDKVKAEILTWDEPDVYAISFFVDNNLAYEYGGHENVSAWSISYNTEKDCKGAGKYSEERWNYAFWRQNEFPIIDINVPNKYTDVLYEWYEEQGITNIGYEDDENAFDEDMNYIGKGPAGHYELVFMAADIAKRLQGESVIKEQFGKEIPIIVHGLEYAWYDIEATKTANPNGEADVFLKAMKELGFY